MLFSNAHRPWKLMALLSMLVIPAVSLAAEDVAPEPERLPGTEAPAALHLVEKDQKAAPVTAPVKQVNPVSRVAAGLGGELVASALLGIGGFYPGLAACEVLGLDDGSFLACFEYGLYGVLAGIVLGLPLGAWAGGKVVGAKGTLLGTALGMGAGVALAAGSLFVLQQAPTWAAALPLALILAGPIVGYEISHALARSSSDSEGVSFQPVVSFSSNGTALGQSGRF